MNSSQVAIKRLFENPGFPDEHEVKHKLHEQSHKQKGSSLKRVTFLPALLFIIPSRDGYRRRSLNFHILCYGTFMSGCVGINIPRTS
jgi:hypothetical protein